MFSGSFKRVGYVKLNPHVVLPSGKSLGFARHKFRKKSACTLAVDMLYVIMLMLLWDKFSKDFCTCR